ncbi:uncharacterized protein [Periplaneta americana]|uniref:uncharacterized protein n=1 Tax=Periplaneta americana TaxID=6978 RepID=UPI0037E958D9
MADIDETAENVANPFGDEDPPEFVPPTPEQLLAVLDQLKGISDEDREQLRQELLMGQQPQEPVQPPLSTEFFVLMSMFIILFIGFVFFGYKLYKSLKEKERKRDEKKKLRQQKKKK